MLVVKINIKLKTQNYPKYSIQYEMYIYQLHKFQYLPDIIQQKPKKV